MPTPRAFREDFDGSALDTRRWRIAATSGGVRVDNLLRLSGGSAGFAFVDSVVDPCADFADFTFSARVRFPQPNACGVGLLATSYRMPVGLSQTDMESVQRREEQNGLTMGVWADATQGMRVWYRSGSTRQEIKVAEADSAWHVLEITDANGAYRISLDSRIVFQAPATAALPRVLSIGNAAVVPTCAGYWTGLEVDSVSVTGVK
jgi:hypothetical protein